MALFEGYKRKEGTRSHTHLVKSGHMSPAEDWLLDPEFNDNSMTSVWNDGVMFKYEYGGPGVEDVVIPKGRIVGIGKKQVKDFVTKIHKTTLTLPGLAADQNTVGMAPYNFTKNYFQNGRFGGNQLSIITMDYVTLPWIPGVAAKTTYDKANVLSEEQALTIDLKMPWGAVIGDAKPGDYLKATPSGRLVKWVKGTDDFVDIVGQVLAAELDQEPWGWTKWMLWPEEYRKEDDVYVNKSGASNLPGDKGYPFDPTYAEGNTTFQEYQSRYVTNPTGIPGLHDGSGAITGYGRNDNEYKDIVLLEALPGSITQDAIMMFQAKNYAGLDLKNLTEVLDVKVNDQAIGADRYTVDYVKGIITITLKSGDAGHSVKASYKAKHYGTPSYADFKGVQGTLHVLLKK